MKTVSDSVRYQAFFKFKKMFMFFTETFIATAQRCSERHGANHSTSGSYGYWPKPRAVQPQTAERDDEGTRWTTF